MKYPPIQVSQPAERINLVSGTLPQWEQLPPAYQRELVLVLSSLLVKQLPFRVHQPEEPQDEQA